MITISIEKGTTVDDFTTEYEAKHKKSYLRYVSEEFSA